MIQILDYTLRDGGYYNIWNCDVSLVNKNINTVSHEIRNNNDVFDVNSQLQTILYWSIIVGIIILIGVLAMYRVHYD